MLSSIAAIIYLCLSVIVILFQAALALGAPWGNLAMGGRHPGRLPPPMRIAALFQMVVLGLLAAVVLSRAGLQFPASFALSTRLIWAVVAFSGLSAVLNIITPSQEERRLWGPVAVVMLLSSLIVALS